MKGKMTPQKRKAILDYIVDIMDKVDPSKTNSALYLELVPKMSDDELIELISSPLPIYAPNGGKVKIDHMRNLEIIREMGYEPFQRVWITDPATGMTTLTKYPHMVLPCPVRRQTQMIDKKISIPVHNRSVDKITGQMSGKSKGSSFSFPQTYVMYAAGYTDTIRELLNTRGGNVKAGQVIDRQIRQFGSSSQIFPGEEQTHVKSSRSLSAFFTAQHLGNNMGKQNASRKPQQSGGGLPLPTAQR